MHSNKWILFYYTDLHNINKRALNNKTRHELKLGFISTFKVKISLKEFPSVRTADMTSRDVSMIRSMDRNILRSLFLLIENEQKKKKK